MPLFYQQHINQHTRLAIWKIEEAEAFFAETVPLQREISHPHKRLQHLAGRYLLRYLFPDFPYEEILIADTRKPYLENETYHFSISHCGDYAAAIVSKTERVGIDIELPSEKILKIAHKFTSDEEMNQLQSMQYEVEENEKQQARNNKRETVLTLIWCAKETMFKWYGLGNVSFQNMLKITGVNEDESFSALIITNDKKHPLTIRYKIFDTILLTFCADASSF